MHFNLKRAVGVMAVPLLGSALAVGAAALPANAATWQDTALSASAVTPDTFGGSGFGVADGKNVIDLTQPRDRFVPRDQGCCSRTRPGAERRHSRLRGPAPALRARLPAHLTYNLVVAVRPDQAE